MVSFSRLAGNVMEPPSTYGVAYVPEFRRLQPRRV